MGKTAVGMGIMLVLAGALIVISEPLYKAIAGRNRPISTNPIYNAGIYEGTARGYGGPLTVRIDVSEYEIRDVEISAPDETPEIGKTAAVKLEKDIWMKQSYNVDSISGATMTSNAIKKALGECFKGAAREGTELADFIAAEMEHENSEEHLPEVDVLLQDIKDGTYTYKDETDDGNGYFSIITVTVENHKITALTWDMTDAEGNGKRELSKSGLYEMTEHGPKWFEQADTLSQYVIQNQTTAGLTGEEGIPDAVASVSIYAGGFADALKACLLTARGDIFHVSLKKLLEETEDGTYSYLSDTADDKGFRDKIDVTVENHKITALMWDGLNADGVGKRALSKEGKYTMSENGPKWYEQADTLAQYIVENQSTNGMSDESGYAGDAVASVSIYIGGFEEALKKCLAQ